jgi:glycogen operon protein
MAADSTIPVWPGKPYPLGTKTDAEGTNFAIFSENASAVDLLLFSQPEYAAASARIRMD